MTAELDTGMDITVELAVDEATKDVLDNGVDVWVELRTGAEATTGSADEGALVTTPSSASSPSRRRALDLSGGTDQDSRSVALPAAADLPVSGGVSPSLLAASIRDVQDSCTPRSSRSAMGLSSDESTATIVLSDGEVEESSEKTRRGPVLRSKAASTEFRSALLQESLEADNDDVLGQIDFAPVGSLGRPSDIAQPSGSVGADSRGVSSGQSKSAATTSPRSSTTRKPKQTSQVVTTLSSMPGAD
ncbi:unnamed protein product [Phytophthora fragariaefolia]|uniref:Unnamed protein product n=1 Tax=Phytophthora fragariaefolia TaxID=1490495 RepID=A0A9W6XPK1_9STRA|nr:unnamed protein product [Phytophthora fragariaefolia]